MNRTAPSNLLFCVCGILNYSLETNFTFKINIPTHSPKAVIWYLLQLYIVN